MPLYRRRNTIRLFSASSSARDPQHPAYSFIFAYTLHRLNITKKCALLPLHQPWRTRAREQHEPFGKFVSFRVPGQKPAPTFTLLSDAAQRARGAFFELSCSLVFGLWMFQHTDSTHRPSQDLFLYRHLLCTLLLTTINIGQLCPSCPLWARGATWH